MMKQFFLLTFTLLSAGVFGQTAWTWTPLQNMPVHVANNAVAFGEDADNAYVFSFGGIDSTKIHSGIHKRAFRYTISTDSWEEIAPLPFALSNIASAASTVKNKIYIIGGYHVEEDHSEISSNEVIRYDPETNTYLSNGAAIPTPIDDQVQCVWRDSLIYVITGWSNTGNVPLVQIYNPALDSWSSGTETPNDNSFKAFGASGAIIGDTIYYYGGASNGFNFPAQLRLRKGVINPENPTNITWTLEENGPTRQYRSAAMTHGNSVFWLGGSAISYNYDGIAYNGSGGVPPLYQISRYDQSTKNWYEGSGAPYGVMDLRGAAQTSDITWIICGGMEEDQVVSNRTFLLTYDPVVGNIQENSTQPDFQLINGHIILSAPALTIEIIDSRGRTTHHLSNNNLQLPGNLTTGIYFIRVNFGEHVVTKKAGIN